MLMQRQTSGDCFHCGEPVPPGNPYSTVIDGEARAMCCPGCQAVAQLISGSGLGSFYRLRTELSERAPVLPQDNPYRLYDLEENRGDFVQPLDGGLLQARLLLGGVSCAACTWLIETALLKLDGVARADVNLSQQSLSVNWDPGQVQLSELFQYLLSLGYDPHPWQARAGAELLENEQRRALGELAVAGLAMMQVGMFAIALHAGDIQGIAGEYRSLMRWVSLIIASLVVGYSARGFFRNAWINLRHGRLVMDLPVALAIGLAYSASAWATLTRSGQVYFDSIAMFTFFLLLGRFLERQVRRQEILRQTDLSSLLPTVCLRDNQGNWESIPTRSAGIGDVLLLRAGDVIPADGRLVGGAGLVDESTFTGEHLPRPLAIGDMVYAGTLLREGRAEISVSRDAASCRLHGMLSLISRASEDKPALARFADRVAARFVGTVLLIAGLVAAWWSWQAPAQALWITLSVLVVSCPCALALATPAALTAATSRLRRAGLLLTGEDSLETLTRSSRIIFDKTGTLTLGALSLREVMTVADMGRDEACAIAAALEEQVRHPFARAFSGIGAATSVSDVEAVPGQGVRGLRSGRPIALGDARFGSELCGRPLVPPAGEGHWIVLVQAGEPLAWFALDDATRPEAATVVSALQAQGMTVELLTGDASESGPRLAAELGIDTVNSGVSPAGKLARIQALQHSGETVIMVGDGLNDAAVLAAADCSFAVNQATDLAKARADGILLCPSLQPLVLALQTARRARVIIRQNMAWALGYNALAVPLAAAGMIPPWLAAIGMSASSLLVVLNSLRLK